MSDKKPKQKVNILHDSSGEYVPKKSYDKAIKALKEIESKCYGDDSIAWGIASNALEELGEEI